MLKSIASVKSAKSEDDMYVCGLGHCIEIPREISQNCILEDPSGSFEGIVFDAELAKRLQARCLSDQFVMARVSLGKNSGYIIKDIDICQIIPDQARNKSESVRHMPCFYLTLHIGSKYFMEEEFTGICSIGFPVQILLQKKFDLC